MTTETNRARPQALSRIDPALRNVASGLDIAEFRIESLPAERKRADQLAAERAAAVDNGSVAIDDRVIAGPGDRQLGLRLYRGLADSAAPLVLYAHGGGFVTGNLDTDH
ncbi:MAG: alpha/beta hydrolase, partial [Mycobacterium sp.]|nr:alpha/beta hydrolase [Mycobacterium sp.]